MEANETNNLKIFLEEFPDNQKEANELNRFLSNDMTLKYFLSNEDLKTFYKTYDTAFDVLRNIEKLQDLGINKLRTKIGLNINGVTDLFNNCLLAL